MTNAAAIAVFIGFTALGVLFAGLVTHFVLAGLFGLSVTFGQSIGIGMVLGLIWGFMGGGR